MHGPVPCHARLANEAGAPVDRHLPHCTRSGTGACEHASAAPAQGDGARGDGAHTDGVGVQRLEVLIAVMLARERMRAADAAGDGCTALAAALATLPSRPLKMIANAVAALGVATVRDECTAASGSDVLSFRTMPADHERWRSRRVHRQRVPHHPVESGILTTYPTLIGEATRNPFDRRTDLGLPARTAVDYARTSPCGVA